MYPPAQSVRKPGFSLVELVIVVVIIGIIAAIAVPRISIGAKGAAEKTLIADLTLLRKAIEMYAGEHNGAFPVRAKFSRQLTLFSNDPGQTNSVRSTTYRSGPYLRRVPKLSVGSLAGKSGVVGGVSPGSNSGGGWWYNEVTGEIRANLKDSEVDADGLRYNSY